MFSDGTMGKHKSIIEAQGVCNELGIPCYITIIHTIKSTLHRQPSVRRMALAMCRFIDDDPFIPLLHADIDAALVH